MRNLFLMLLLANILFFAWQHYIYDPDAGVTIAATPSGGDRLVVIPREEQAPVEIEPAAVDTLPEPATTTALSAAVGRACLSVGPFSDVDQASNALSDLTGAGFESRQRATQGQVFIGHWVYVDNIPTRAQARSLLAKLQEGGLGDAILMAGSPGEDIISLGLFSALEGAERTELQAKSLGVEVFVTRREREATVFWLDTRLQADQTADTVIEAFGRDKVLRGSAATCPREV